MATIIAKFGGDKFRSGIYAAISSGSTAKVRKGGVLAIVTPWGRFDDSSRIMPHVALYGDFGHGCKLVRSSGLASIGAISSWLAPALKDGDTVKMTIPDKCCQWKDTSIDGFRILTV